MRLKVETQTQNILTSNRFHFQSGLRSAVKIAKREKKRPISLLVYIGYALKFSTLDLNRQSSTIRETIVHLTEAEAQTHAQTHANFSVLIFFSEKE